MPRHLSVKSSALVILLAVPASLSAQDREPRVRADGLRTIAVAGLAEEAVTPDVAELTVGVETQSPTATESLAANSKEMNALMDVLRKQGIAPDDVQTSQLGLSPTYDRAKSEGVPDQPAAKIVGYRVNTKVIINLRDAKKAGELLDLMVKAGVNQIDGLRFEVSDKKSLLRNLRKRAIDDARTKAGEAARDAEMILGNPISINVSDLEINSGYAFMARTIKSTGLTTTTPIALGQEMVRVAVEVVYEMKPPR